MSLRTWFVNLRLSSLFWVFVLGGKHHLLAILDDFFQENRKKLWIPEIALQNTLKTGRRWSNLESLPQKFQQEHQRKHTHTFLRFLVFPPIGFWVCWWTPLFWRGELQRCGDPLSTGDHLQWEGTRGSQGSLPGWTLVGEVLCFTNPWNFTSIPRGVTFSKVSAYPFAGFWGCRSANVRKYLSKYNLAISRV